MKNLSSSAIFIIATLAGFLLIGLLVVSTNGGDVYSKFTLPLQITEYFDYACSHCQDFEPTMEEIESTFGEDVEVEYVYFNLFPSSLEAAYAAEAAREQGKFTEYHKALFVAIEELKTQAGKSYEDLDLEGIATELGLDIEQFNADRADSTIQSRISDFTERGNAEGVTGTPTVFIDGVKAQIETDSTGSFAPFVTKVSDIIQKIKSR